MTESKRTPVRQKAKQLAKYLREENPDYDYLRQLFRHLRTELSVDVTHKEQKLPYVPTEEEIHKYYEAVWKSRNMKHVLMIKTLLYTGVRVSELIHIKLGEIDFDRCQIRVTEGKGKKDRIVPFPGSFKEVLAIHVHNRREKGGEYLFESSWKNLIQIVGYARFLKITPKQQEWNIPFLHINYDIFYLLGLRNKVLMIH